MEKTLRFGVDGPTIWKAWTQATDRVKKKNLVYEKDPLITGVSMRPRGIMKPLSGRDAYIVGGWDVEIEYRTND